MVTDTEYLENRMKRFVRLLRERYIVEFPRPANATGGRHLKEIKIAGSDPFIRPAGISVPILDPAVLADPTTVSAGPKDTPELGDRHIITKPW
jgi:hypothetical protein